MDLSEGPLLHLEDNDRMKGDTLPFTPVVIIGAGRSGTNALRDAVTRLPQFATWPCDEINPIWRHGNLDHPDDALSPEKATPVVRRYIRNAFHKLWCQQGKPDFVVEKTCANSLRVPFVAAVLPEARYVYIARDGFDVVASAEKRWRGDLEMLGLSYFLAKARYAPLTDLPRYALLAIRSRLAVLMGRQAYLDSWGPRFAGMNELAGVSLEEIVARQWTACVMASDAAFAAMEQDKYCTLSYEDFTADPAASLVRIASWLDSTPLADDIAAAAAIVRKGSVGKGRALAERLDPSVIKILDTPLRKHGYRE